MKHTPCSTRTSIFLSAVVALAQVGTAYSFEPQYECTTNGSGNWAISVLGPTSIECPDPAGGECTEMQYDVQALTAAGQNQDHVAVLVAQEAEVVAFPNTSVSIYPACDGDGVTNIGIRDCSRQAVRLNTKDNTGFYPLIVRGAAVAIDSSIVVKKGRNNIEECRIASLGTLPPPECNPKEQLPAKKVFEFEGCVIEITLDPCTGDPGEAQVLSGDCGIDSGPVESLQLVINGTTQNVTVGEGYISSGENSCTTTLIGKQKYTTCTCLDVSDCLVKTSNGTCLCEGKGICGALGTNVCN
jgi:hypothetical protein